MSEEDQRTQEEHPDKRAREHGVFREAETEADLSLLAGESEAAIKRREQELVESAQEGEDALGSLESGMDPQELARLREEAGMHRIPEIKKEVADIGSRARRAIGMTLRAPVTEAPEAVPPPWKEVRIPAETEQTVERKERIKDPALERLDRQLRLASSVERLQNGEPLGPEDRARLAGALEGRGWHKIFYNLESGEAVVAVMTPPGGETYQQTPDERLRIIEGVMRSGELRDVYGSAEAKEIDKALGFEPFGIFGVKRLNDDFFGPQLTDAIIDKRRALVSEYLGGACTELEQSYKDGFFKLTREQVADPEKRAASIVALTRAISRINEGLRAFIPQMIAKAKDELIREVIPQASERLQEADSALAGAKNPAEPARRTEERNDAVERRKDAANRYLKLHLFEPIFEREGYELNFGVRDVAEASADGQEVGYAHVELALAESLQAAKRSREVGDPGRDFAESDPSQMVFELKEIRDRIANEDIVDIHGRSYPIFQLESDGITRTLNTDIVRDLRKGKFKVREDQAELLGLVQEYLRKVNVLDIVKPYTHEEIAGANIYGTSFTLRNQLETTASIANRIRSGENLTEQERTEAALALKREGKDRSCASAMEFHSRAMGMDECTYLTIDVLDVGPKLVREFDRLVQQAEQGKMTFEEASVAAGDGTTRMMRTFRDTVTRVYREHTGDPEAVPAMLVGGDEATIAIDRTNVQVTDAFLMKLRNATNSRVVETVVSGADRTTSSEADEERRRGEHLRAQKLAEQGSGLAKALERSRRDCEDVIRDLPAERQKSFLDSLDQLNVRNFVVKQSDGGFRLVVEDPERPGTGLTLPPVEFQGVLSGVEALTDRIKAEARSAHEALLSELRSAHPKLTRDVMPKVQRMKNYLKNDEAFRAYLEKYG